MFRVISQTIILRIILMVTLGFLLNQSQAQNITPKPTKRSVLNSEDKNLDPTSIRFYEVKMEQIFDARVEVITDTRIVFSQHAKNLSSNRRLYVWNIKEKELWNTLEDGVQNSVIAPEDGEYILFLHNELESGRDIDGDGVHQTVLRMYHFETGQKINLGIPARSATPLPGDTSSKFEYKVENDVVTFSVSQKSNNYYLDREAPWNIVDLKPVLKDIKANLTPTRTPTQPVANIPTPSATPTPPPPSPSATPTPTLSPTPIPPEESLVVLEVNFELEKMFTVRKQPKIFGNNIVVGRHQDAVVVTQKDDKDYVTWYVQAFVKDVVETTHGRKIAGINYAGSNSIAILVENTIDQQWELYRLKGAFKPASIKDFTQY